LVLYEAWLIIFCGRPITKGEKLILWGSSQLIHMSHNTLPKWDWSESLRKLLTTSNSQVLMKGGKKKKTPHDTRTSQYQFNIGSNLVSSYLKTVFHPKYCVLVII
jgi:hypothetical protein